jgi:hypothetical protein
VPFSNHVSLSSQSSSVSISSHILPCFCLTAFLTGSHPDISIVWEFSFTSVFRIVCQILSSFILRTIPYHATVLFFLYSKVFTLKIMCCVLFCVSQLYYTHKRLLSATVNVCTNICLGYVYISVPCEHCTIYSTFTSPQFVSNNYLFLNIVFLQWINYLMV